MKRALRFFAVASAASLALTACSDKSDLVDSERAPAPGEELGAVTLELVQVPADIRCVSVKVESYKTVTRNIDVTPGSTSVYRMTALPTGLARVTGAAFETACASLTEGVVPGWVSEVPVLAQISVLEVTHVALALVRNGRATVGVDFEPVGPGVTPPPPGPVPGGGFSSAAPYIVPVAPGVSIRAILTVGDSVNAKPDGTPYRMVGLPDGMGAFDNSDGTFTLLSNHEIGATAGGPRAHGGRGAFVSKWIIRKSDLAVLNGEDLMKSTVLWDATTSAYRAPSTGENFGRFCSADLPERGAFYDAVSGLGFNGRLFLNGEEIGDEGRGMAHGLDGVSWDLPRTGKFSWENSLAHPNPGVKTIVVGMDDSTPGQVYVYVGNKTSEGSPVARAGLTNGVLYGVKVAGVPTEDVAVGIPSGTAFELHSLGNVENSTGAALEAASNAAGVTRFARPEDGAWDPNNRNHYYFVTTASFSTASRLWRLRFADISRPELGGQLDMLLDGSEGQRMFDNIAVTRSGHVYLQEDPGNQVHIAKVWRYGIATDALVLVAQFSPPLVTTGMPGFITQDEESSGVIDASDLLGPGWLLINAEMHTSAGDTELVERGQFLALFDPAAVF